MSLNKTIPALPYFIILLFTCFININASAATFNIPDGDINALKTAIITANTNNQSDIINLVVKGTYELTTADNSFTGDIGLPRIILDGNLNNTITINGNGATLTRKATAPRFRLLYVLGGKLIIKDLILTNGKAEIGTHGGAIIANTGELEIYNSTFTNNISGFFGGAIYNEVSTHTALTNCTFYNNTAPYGSAIWNNDGTMNITNCTITGNIATNVSGKALTHSQATSSNIVYLKNSIVAGNASGTAQADLDGYITSQGKNLIGSNAGANTPTYFPAGSPNGSGDYVGSDAIPIDAKLNSLADNGGYTPTIALQATSLAVNNGASSGAPTTDQRGYTRTGNIDIGAFEYNGIIPAPTIAANGLSPESGSIGTSITITGTNLSNITQIQFTGSTAITSGFTNNTSTSVTVTVPTGTTTGPVIVTTPKGSSSPSAQDFKILAAPTITFGDMTKKYGDVPFFMTAQSNSTGTISYSIISGNGANIDANTGKVNISSSGTLTIKATQNASSSYLAATATAQLTISKANLTIAVKDTTREFGKVNPTVRLIYTGYVNGDGIQDLNQLPSVSNSTNGTTIPGTYPLTLSGGNDDNYNYILTNGNLTITKAIPTLTMNSSLSGKIKDTIKLDVNSESPVAITYSIVPGGTGTATINIDSLFLLTQGTILVKAEQLGNTNYLATSKTFTITINNALGNISPYFQTSSIFPNPFSDKLNVELNHSERGIVKIYNLAGNLIKQLEIEKGSSSIETTDFLNGMYIVQIMEGNRILMIEKLIK